MDYPKESDLHNGKFTNGDPVLGIAPSVDSAEHMNAIYDELIHLIESASITPDTTNKTQLLEAINYYRNASNMVEGTIPIERLPYDLTGSIHYFAMLVAPTGFIKANGDEVSRTDYANLFAKIGTTFGDGDGSTTFNVPDLRGEFIRGWDDGREVDANRTLGSWQDSENKVHTHTTNGNFITKHTHGYDGDLDGSRTITGYDKSSINAVIGDTGGNESRPRNITLLACIKY